MSSPEEHPSTAPPLPMSGLARRVLRESLGGEETVPDDSEMLRRRQEGDRTKQVERTISLCTRLRGTRKATDQKISITTDWVTVPDIPDDRMHTEARLQRIEKVEKRFLGIPTKRRVSEIRVEIRAASENGQQTSDPYCAYFMKPARGGMPAVLDMASSGIQADSSHTRIMPETDEWQGLENILAAFEQRASTDPIAS